MLLRKILEEKGTSLDDMVATAKRQAAAAPPGPTTVAPATSSVDFLKVGVRDVDVYSDGTLRMSLMTSTPLEIGTYNRIGGLLVNDVPVTDVKAFVEREPTADGATTYYLRISGRTASLNPDRLRAGPVVVSGQLVDGPRFAGFRPAAPPPAELANPPSPAPGPAGTR
jgi:hypothetical protein